MVKRLNLGCGTDYRDGWVNVDLDKKVRADLRFDLRRRFPLKENGFDFMLVQDVLEHFTKEETIEFLTECWRVLRKGGRLELRIPNILQIIQQFKDDPEVMMMFIYGITRKSGRLGTHKFGYTRESLSKLLKTSGFKPISIEEETTNYVCKAKKVKRNVGKIKVLISGQDSGGIGGSEIFLYQLSYTLARKKVKTSFTVVRDSAYYKLLRKSDITIFPTPVRMDIIGGWKGALKFIVFFLPALFWNYQLLSKFKKRGGRIVLLPGISDKIILTPLAKILDLSIIWIDYASSKDLLTRNLYLPKVFHRLIKDLADLVIVPSENTLKNLIPHARISLAKTKIIPLGIELLTNKEIQRMKRNKTKVRKQLGIKSKKIIGMVSRIEADKGQDTLLKAASILKRKISDFVVLIVGDGDIQYLKDLASTLNINKQVKFLGFKKGKEKFQLISAFDIAVFPTRWELEGFGLVSVEAMMMKIPLVASKFGPVPEVVGDSAILVEPKPKELASAIEQLLANSKKAEKLVESGRKRVEKYFDINKIADLYIKEFEDLLRIHG